VQDPVAHDRVQHISVCGSTQTVQLFLPKAGGERKVKDVGVKNLEGTYNVESSSGDVNYW
jgi:hypothetical protein